MDLRTPARLLLLALTGNAALLAASSPATAALRCEAQIMKALAEASVPQSDIKSIKVTRGGGGGKSPTNSSYDAWIRLKSCSGYMMVSMTRTCHINDVYTKGDCRFSGMSAY